jgi:hypothetical protein
MIGKIAVKLPTERNATAESVRDALLGSPVSTG